MVLEYNFKSILRNNLFKGVPDHFVKKFYNLKNFQSIKEGTIIFSPQDESSFLYLIVQGEVKIKYTGQKQLINKYLYDFFGETEIRRTTKRISSAVANTDCMLYKISSDELHTICSGNITVNRNLKNISDIDENEQSDFIYSELGLPLSTDNINDPEIDLSELEQPEEVFSDVSEAELESIIEKQKEQQEFRNVMKKVGSFESDETLKQELLGDLDLSDSDEWRLAAEE
jgi:signal-transduction protein with cAMP-binding, CBS, and nucleotidyltransferase domain